MSMWYDEAVLLILNWTVPPRLTLIDVAKPWIVGSPELLSCQSLGGSPCLVFSHAITLTTGGPHGPAADEGRACSAVATMAATAITAMTPARWSGLRVTWTREDPCEGKNWVICRRPVASRKLAE